jgi:hypothetical protein
MDDIPVLGIYEIAFQVRDLERSIAFIVTSSGYPYIRVGRSKHGFASERSVWHCLLRIGQAVANILHCLSHRKRQSRRAVL